MANLFFRTNIAPYRVDIYNMLHEQLGFELYFYRDFDTSQKLDMDSILKECRFTPHYLEGLEIAPSRKICTGLFKILKENQPDIVIVPEFQILFFQVWFFRLFCKKKFKIISMCDDSYNMVVEKNEFTFIHRLARKIALPLLDSIISLDYRVKDWYVAKYGKGIYLPIIRDEEKEIQELNAAINHSNRLIHEYNLVGKKILLFVGRLVNLKNIDRLLDAVNLCKEDFSVVIVGSGKEEDSLKSKAQAIAREIVFTGQQQGENLKAWYNIGDAFILPSYLEPFGAVTNEALVAGEYVLISKNAGSSTLVTKNNGLIFDPYDITEMANCIDTVMKKITKGDNIIVKPHKMPFTFSEIVEQFKQEIYNV